MIKHSEIFYSFQGEGRWLGTPSVFLRTFGCNFECRGFGQGRDKSKWVPKDKMPHVVDPNISKYKSYRDLPVAQIGCDTSATWSMLYHHLAMEVSYEKLAENITNLIPNKTWYHNLQDTHFILTGGEPLLWQKKIPFLLQQKQFWDLKNLTFETNGSKIIQKEFYDFWLWNTNDIHVTFAVSPKLSISGEPWHKAINPRAIESYMKIPNSELFFKFVVSDEQDVEEVHRAFKEFDVKVPVYLMPCGGTLDTLQQNEVRVANLALQNGFRFSPRAHVNIFGNKWGT